MLKKIIEIRNVGRLRDCKSQGDATLRRVTLLFAGNARGKTTLSDVLRSLHSTNPAVIEGRATLGSLSAPYIELLFDSGKVVFENGIWSASPHHFAIYDSHFVHANVHSGSHVEHDHRKGLYRIIIGAQGVALAHQVEELDQNIRTLTRQITERLSTIKTLCGPSISPEEFLALHPDAQIADKIQLAEGALSAVRKAAELAKRPTLAEVRLLEFPADLESVLASGLPDLTSNVERQVADHATQHMKQRDDSWLATGVELQVGKSCPFCGQSVSSSYLLAAFKTLFSTEYAQLKNRVDNLSARLDSFASDADLRQLEHSLEENIRRAEYWSQFLPLTAPSLDLPTIIQSLRQVRSEAQQVLTLKKASLLEPIATPESFALALKLTERVLLLVREYNVAIRAMNGLIEAKRTGLQAMTVVQAQECVSRLRLSQLRHTPDVVATCNGYTALVTEKQALERKKKQARADLDAYTATVFPKYEKRINELLVNFGATFTIANTGASYAGGKPSSTYQLVINKMAVDLGDASSPEHRPSFRNTLSAGDKSSLALAFFLAQLEQDERLQQAIVVVDDPFSSHDSSRRRCTKQELCSIGGKAKQLIVLSHDPWFLKLLHDDLQDSDLKGLQLSHLAEKGVIQEWDVTAEVRSDFAKHQDVLRGFLNHGKGSPSAVATSIRPLLEGYMRLRLPDHLGSKAWLGTFISAIRDAAPDSPLAAAQTLLPELEAVNDYSSPFHHSDGSALAGIAVDSEELSAFIRRALKLVSAF